MPITTISLDGRQIEQEAAMQTEQVKSVGSDLSTFAIAQGMTGVLNFVAVDCPNAATPQFGKGLQKVGGLAWPSPGVEFPRDFVEELESALGVQAIEERTALDQRVADLLLLREEISAAASLAEGAEEAQAEKVRVGDAWAAATGARIILADIFHRCQKLVEE
jgi:hypothetical protein